MLGDTTKNCHTYCPYAKYCRYAKGENGIDPDDCAMYWKIDDLMMDARIAREQEDDDE